MKLLKFSVLTFLIFFSIILAGKAQTAKDRKEISDIIIRQGSDWNQGNIDNYMNGYWKSDSLRFVGKNGIQYGWKNTLENYKKSYPDLASMGTLQLDILNLEFLNKDAAFIIGKWFLKRPEKGDIGGHFTLLWKKINGKWVIVADHSS